MSQYPEASQEDGNNNFRDNAPSSWRLCRVSLAKRMAS
jgi:hypothetical protein